MKKILEELKEAEINDNIDLSFYKGVVHCLYKLNKINADKKAAFEENLELRLYEVK